MTTSNATKVLSYEYLFVQAADSRVENWLFMKDPTYPLLIICLYLYAVYIYIPNVMKNRKPFDLKGIIQVYNIVQVACCIMLIYRVATSGWTTHLSLGCEPVDYSNKPLSVQLLACVWWTMWLKALELVETIFFSLRKKEEQITKLHVYHHCSTFLLAWTGAKYIGGGMATFPILINSFIHVLMYSYYFVSAFGPKIQQKISFLKPKLTMLQMIQFCILLLHASQGLRDDCAIPNLSAYMYMPNILIIFAFFINFYVKRYTADEKTKTT